MRYLLDTHVLLWTLYAPEKLSPKMRDVLSDPEPEIWFSAANIWEIAIKSGLGRPDFTVDPLEARMGALHLGFIEVAVDGAHGCAVSALPDIHRDPFDRILVAQAASIDLTLLTHDESVAKYPGKIQLV
ncbi:type II toxin-antitoxin system VapC family toxin [Promicromonospora sp. NPDC023805]|uniref:type II toxin-antitoxin system VapC family toxin n=1 Tax=Promicromonospora sp. NPDC023805 TaxID=3154696 RepID=UPI0033F0C820